jgi:aryl-alcohol dehydrogenase-like predicted oxidoreductase
MGMTPLYGTPDPNEAKRTIHQAVDAGVTMIDTADAIMAATTKSWWVKR